MSLSKVDISNIKVDKVTTKSLLSLIKVSEKEKIFLASVNPESVILSKKNKEMFKALNSADIVTADGTGILWAAKFLSYETFNNPLKFLEIPFLAISSLLSIIFYPKHLRTVLPERVSGSDLFWDLIKIAKEARKKIFLLGGEEGIALQVKEKLERKFDGIKIVGAYPGGPEEEGLVDRINSSDADYLFVAWGQPKQEVWISNNIRELNIDFAFGIGGTLDFIAGKQKRSPKVLQRLGLEWLWRFVLEPKRIKRIFAAVPVFIYAVIKEKFKENNHVTN